MSSEPQPNVQWQSVRWPDKSTYEGLVKGDKCHVRGVFNYSNGDRYEGEFQENDMSGYGVYVWGQEGSVYRGQWSHSMMHGCGVKITKQPAGGYLAEEGQFVNDEWVGEAMACSIEQARAAAAAADTAAQMARVFELGDGGDLSGSAARAQEAAAAAAAAAAQAKSRKYQRQQQQADGQPSNLAAGPLHSGSGQGGTAGGRQHNPVQSLLDQARRGAQGAAQQAAAWRDQAGHAAHKAVRDVQQLLRAGQQKLQHRQRTPKTTSA